MSNID